MMAVSFPGFVENTITVTSDDGPIEIAYLIGGSGPPLLLLRLSSNQSNLESSCS